MEDTSAAIYSEAKSEYTKQLIFNFQPVLLRFFLDRYTEAKSAPTVTSKTVSALSEFQESLSHIPDWNLDKVQRETAGLLQGIHCDYTEDLITAVFIAHTKILSAIRLHAKPRRKINITVPKPEHFMHRAMSECSRLLWSNIYLFSDSVSSLDRQKNMNEVNRFLEEGILQAIRNLLPVKSILRDSLQEEDDDAIHIASPDGDLTTPSVSMSPSTEPVTEPLMESVATPLMESVAEPLAEPLATPVTESLQKRPETLSVVKLDVETEKSVGFTGMDSVFGDGGHAELRPMIDEGSDEFKILDGSEELSMNEFEDLNAIQEEPVSLSVADYETL